jgi:outer membrane protein insertion porin family
LAVCLLCCCCSGYGFGGGIRIDSPLGPVRLEYAWNDQRRGRFHVALGYD